MCQEFDFHVPSPSVHPHGAQQQQRHSSINTDQVNQIVVYQLKYKRQNAYSP